MGELQPPTSSGVFNLPALSVGNFHRVHSTTNLPRLNPPLPLQQAPSFSKAAPPPFPRGFTVCAAADIATAVGIPPSASALPNLRSPFRQSLGRTYAILIHTTGPFDLFAYPWSDHCSFGGASNTTDLFSEQSRATILPLPFLLASTFLRRLGPLRYLPIPTSRHLQLLRYGLCPLGHL